MVGVQVAGDEALQHELQHEPVHIAAAVATPLVPPGAAVVAPVDELRQRWELLCQDRGCHGCGQHSGCRCGAVQKFEADSEAYILWLGHVVEAGYLAAAEQEIKQLEEAKVMVHSYYRM